MIIKPIPDGIKRDVVSEIIGVDRPWIATWHNHEGREFEVNGKNAMDAALEAQKVLLIRIEVALRTIEMAKQDISLSQAQLGTLIEFMKGTAHEADTR